MNIYKLSSEIRFILRAVEESGGELTPEHIAQLNALSGDIHGAIDTLTKLASEAELEEETTRKAAAAITRSAQRHATRKEKLRGEIQTLMDAAGMDRAEGELFNVSVRLGPLRVVVDSSKVTVENLPIEFVRVTEEVNLQALADAIKANEKAGEVVVVIPEGVTTERRKVLYVTAK